MSSSKTNSGKAKSDQTQHRSVIQDNDDGSTDTEVNQEIRLANADASSVISQFLAKQNLNTSDECESTIADDERVNTTTNHLQASDTPPRRGRWLESEDIQLYKAVRKHGQSSWQKVSRSVPGRTDVQCRNRWVFWKRWTFKNTIQRFRTDNGPFLTFTLNESPSTNQDESSKPRESSLMDTASVLTERTKKDVDSPQVVSNKKRKGQSTSPAGKKTRDQLHRSHPQQVSSESNPSSTPVQHSPGQQMSKQMRKKVVEMSATTMTLMVQSYPVPSATTPSSSQAEFHPALITSATPLSPSGSLSDSPPTPQKDNVHPKLVPVEVLLQKQAKYTRRVMSIQSLLN